MNYRWITAKVKTYSKYKIGFRRPYMTGNFRKLTEKNQPTKIAFIFVGLKGFSLISL